jgi:hypothetical protein
MTMANEITKEETGKFVEIIGENAETVRKGLNDKRLQDAFIEAIDEDPQLIEVLAKVTPKISSVAADWSCCRGNRPGLDLEEIVNDMKRRVQQSKESGGG